MLAIKIPGSPEPRIRFRRFRKIHILFILCFSCLILFNYNHILNFLEFSKSCSPSSGFKKSLPFINAISNPQESLFAIQSISNYFNGNPGFSPPVDAVYTWVNGSDPEFIDLLKRERQLLYAQRQSANLKEFAAEENCESLIPTWLVIIQKDKSVDRANLLLPSSAVELNLLQIKKVNRRLFLFSSESEAQAYVLRAWNKKIDEQAGQVLLSQKCPFNKNPESKITISNMISIRKSDIETVDENLLHSLQSLLNNLKLTFYQLPENPTLSTYSFIVNADLAQLNEIKNKLNSEHVKIDQIDFNIRLLTGFKLVSIKPESISKNRFYDNDELRYSLRSIQKFAPWIRNIYIVTNGQRPNWLNLNNTRVKVITHDQIFRNKSHLPTFNSAAIETHLHLIPGLSRFFIYFNDDMFFGKPVYLSDYLTERGVHRVRLGWPLPPCSTGCARSWLRDGVCDKACNVSQCLWDGGDCLPKTVTPKSNQLSMTKLVQTKARPGRPSKLPPFLLRELSKKFKAKECSAGCGRDLLNDYSCDSKCNVKQCAFDLGDCNFEQFRSIATFQSFDSKKLNWQHSSSFLFEFQTRHPAIGLNFTDFLHNFQTNHSKVHSKIENKFRQIRSKANNKSILLIDVFCLYENVVVTFDVRRQLLLVLLDSDDLFEDLIEVYLQLLVKGSLLDLKLDFKVNYINDADDLENKSSPSIDQSTANLKNLALFVPPNSKNGQLSNSSQINEQYTSTTSSPSTSMNEIRTKGSSRRLLDVYLDTLMRVDRLYNQHFPIQARKVIPHMPLLIDSEIIRRMQSMFESEVEETSSHRFRNSNDLQFAFSYVYFLMSETKSQSFGEIIKHADTNHNGMLSKNELHGLLAKLVKLPIKNNFVEESWIKLCQCSGQSESDPEQVKEIEVEKLFACDELVQQVELKFDDKNANEFEVVNEKGIGFRMITDDAKKVQTELDQYRAATPTFITINDDIKTDDPKLERKIRSIVRNFYEWLLPLPSDFEIKN